ncbi:MAG: alpha-2-macroglobulin [Planctomycetaceae bacterium]|jgi:uncharacterized protein YfaS (alpha-2-macroglobulin family)|nr:alpha-2-macroglobulin [Planctomycetaceae bacterium]
MKRTIFTFVLILASFIVLQGITFNISNNNLNFCCANEKSVQSPNEAVNKLIETGKFKDAYDIVKKLILNPQEPENQKYLAQHKIKIADLFAYAALSLQQLNRISEIDELLEQASTIYKNDWRILTQIALTYQTINHYGTIIDNKFIRGFSKGGRHYKSIHHRDLVQSLMILMQARHLAIKDNNKEDLAQFFFNLSDVIYSNVYRSPLSLTDISKLPDYSDNDQQYFQSYTNFTPVDKDNNPIFYEEPETFESAKNNTERWRWALAQAARICPEKYLVPVLLKRAEFNHAKFGTTTLDNSVSNIYPLESLSDTETIAQTAGGIKRFTLPDDHNFIKLYREAYNAATRQQKYEIGMSLANIYQDRQQYVKAAEVLNKIIKDLENDKSIELKYCRQHLDQIIGNRGIFTKEGSEVNCLNANLRLVFRNGKKVTFTAREINIKKCINDLKQYYTSIEKHNHGEDQDYYYKLINPTRLLQFFCNTNDDQTYLDPVSKKILKTKQFYNQYVSKEAAVQWEQELIPAKNHFDADTIVQVPIKKAGLYLIESKMENGNKDSVIVWLNDTAIIQKITDDHINYLVVDLETSNPIKNAQVELCYCYNSDSYMYHKYDTNKTDKNGIAKFDKTEIKGKTKKLHISENLVIASTADGKFTVLGMPWIQLTNNNNEINNRTKCFVITDRPVYRPKDKVQIKGWIGSGDYNQPNQNKQQEENKSINYSIRNPKHEIIHDQNNIKLDAYGGFTASFELPEDADLGQYSIECGDGKNSYSVNFRFRVEEYKKPEYEVTIETPSEPVKLGDKFNVTIKAKYFFGSPVTDATVKYSVLRTIENDYWYPVRFWDWLYGNGYSWFGYDTDWLPNWKKWCCCRPSSISRYRNYSPPEQVLNKETKIGEDGTVKFEIDSSNTKLSFPNNNHKYTITAEVIDNSRRTITGKGTVLVSYEPFKIYAYTDRGYYNPNQKIKVNFQTRRIDGKKIKGNGEATLYKMTYQKQTGKNSYEPVETKVYSENITFNDDGSAELKLNAAEAGQYKISCTLNGQEGGYVFNVFPNSHEMKTAENKTINKLWQFNTLELIPDKAEYELGENVNLRINTARENSSVFVCIREKNKTNKIINLIEIKGNTAEIKIPVTLLDMPNFFVEAITIANGQVIQEVKEIVVPPQKQILNVEIQPNAENYKPNDKAKAKLIVTDINGKPITGQIAVSVYDKSVEYISGGSNISDIKEFFWKWKRYHNNYLESSLQNQLTIEVTNEFLRHSLKDNDNSGIIYNSALTRRNAVKSSPAPMPEQTRALAIGGLAIGGLGDGLVYNKAKDSNISAEFDAIIPQSDSVEQSFIDPLIRKNFADTAYWNGIIETDQNGVAEIEFNMPESLTTWKINVWSMAHGTRVGSGSTQVITRKDLIVRMQTPRFLVEKDQVLFTANVHNYLKTDKNVLVQLESDGDLIAFDKNTSSKQIKVTANGEAKIDWLVDAKKAGSLKIRMFAKTDEESDAIEKTIPIYVHGILKQEAWSGYIAPDKNSSTIEINVPSERKPEQTKLTLRYSPTLAMSLIESLPYLAEYPYGCTEQTLNRFLPTVLVQKTLIDMNIDLAKLEKSRANLNAQELGDNRKPLIATKFSLQKRNPVYSIKEVQKMVDEGVKKLTQMQNSDGGWGWFSKDRSYPHLTALVLHGLIIARNNDVPIDKSIFERGQKCLLQYQNEEVKKIQNYQLPDDKKKNKKTKQYADSTDAFVLMVIGEIETALNNRNNKTSFYKSYPSAGQMRDFLYRDRGKLTLYGVAMEGIFETSLLGEIERAKECLKILEQYLVNDDENQTAYLNLQKYNGWYWWHWDGSEFEIQAYYLKLLMRIDAKNPIAPRLVKYLLNNRRNATYWHSTRDTAICIESFVEYLNKTGESKPDITVDILFDNKLQKTVTINSDNLFEIDNTLTLTDDKITSGLHKIELRKHNNSTNTSPLYFNAYLENFSLEDSIKSAGLELKINRRIYLLEQDNSAKTETIGSRGQIVEQHVKKYNRVITDQFKSGDLIEIELLIDSKNDYESLMITDWKSAGLEPIEVKSGYNGNELGAYVEFRDERVVFFVYRLLKGKYSVTYKLRAEQPGKFSALPTKIEAMYAPELKANSDENKIKIQDK